MYEVVEYKFEKLFDSSFPISDAFFLIDNRVLSAILILVGLSAFALCFFRQSKSLLGVENNGLQRRLERIAFFITSLGTFSWSYALTDEVFVNLVHPLHLIQHGKFSFSPVEKVDGTVESLFYFFHIVGLTETGIIIVNFLLCYILFYLSGLLIQKILRPQPQLSAGLLLLYSTFPSVVYSSSTGFGSVWMTFLFLSAFYVFLEKRYLVMSVFCGLISMSRPEGVLFALIFSFLVSFRSWRATLWSAGISVVATLTYFSFYKLYYGHWLPTPLLFKKIPDQCLSEGVLPVFGSLMLRGLKIFTTMEIDEKKYLIASALKSQSTNYQVYIWPLLCASAIIVAVVVSYRWILKKGIEISELRIRALSFASIIFLLTLLSSVIYTAPPGSLAGTTRYYLIQQNLLFIIIFGFFNTSYSNKCIRIAKNTMFGLLVFDCAHIVYTAKIQTQYNRNFDAQMGKFIADAPAHFTVSTSELNTLGYFSKREIYDLWGYVNKGISESGIYYKNYGKKINPSIFQALNPALALNYSANSKFDWSLDRIHSEKHGDLSNSDYSLQNLIQSPAVGRRDYHERFKFPENRRWLVENVSLPMYQGEPEQVFRNYNVYFVHDGRQMFSFLVRKDLEPEIIKWLQDKGGIEKSRVELNYLPPRRANDFSTSDPQCKAYLRTS